MSPVEERSATALSADGRLAQQNSLAHRKKHERRPTDPAEARPQKALRGRHRTGHPLLRFILILVTATSYSSRESDIHPSGTFGGYFVCPASPFILFRRQLHDLVRIGERRFVSQRMGP